MKSSYLWIGAGLVAVVSVIASRMATRNSQTVTNGNAAAGPRLPVVDAGQGGTGTLVMPSMPAMPNMPSMPAFTLAAGWTQRPYSGAVPNMPILIPQAPAGIFGGIWG